MFEKIKEFIRRKIYPCETCKHRYKRYEWSNGHIAYSCRLKRGKWNNLRIVDGDEKCKRHERRER